MARNVTKIERLGLGGTVDAMLDAKKEYDEIIAEVKTKHEISLTRSSISRYRTNREVSARRIEEIKAQVESVLKMQRENPHEDLAGAGVTMLLINIIARFKGEVDGFSKNKLLDVSHLLVKTTRLGQGAEALELMRERLELSKKKAVKVAEDVKDTMTRSGVSGEEIMATVDKILGVTD